MINKFKDFFRKIFRRKRDSQIGIDDGPYADVPSETGEVENNPDANDPYLLDENIPEDDKTKEHRLNTLLKVDEKKDDLLEPVPSRWKFLLDRASGRFKFSRPNKFLNYFKSLLSSKRVEGVVFLSPNISKGIERFLSKSARENIHQISLIGIICALTFSIAKISALFLKGPPHLDSPREFAVEIDLGNEFNTGTLAQIKTVNPFKTNTGLGSGKKIADSKCEEAKQESNLPIKLVNTIVLQDSVKSLASVQIRGDRLLQELREGEKISNLAKIFKISRFEILVKNFENGVCESISSQKDQDFSSPISLMSESKAKEFKALKKMAGIDNEGNKFIISKTLLDEKMKDIAAILTQARAVKIQNPDGSLGFKMTEMDPQGIFPYIGLQDQDIIVSINGKPIYDMNEIMGLFARIKNLDKLQLGIKREGSESVLDYSIKK